MLKKLLTLSLVAVMLSTVVFASPVTYTLAAELEETAAETVDDELNVDGSNMELLWVQQAETDGAVSQTVKACTWTANVDPKNNDWWGLAKVKVGKNWNFTSLSLSMRLGYRNGNCRAYVIPLSKSDYEAAYAVAGTKETINSLTEPETVSGADFNETGDKTYTNTPNNQTMEIALTASAFTEEHYQDEYVYLAFQIVQKVTDQDGTEQDATTIFSRFTLKDTSSYWKLVGAGTRTLETATATVTAAYVNASVEGQQTITGTLASGEYAAQNGNKRWAFYKFETENTYERISEVALNVNFTVNNKFATIFVYPMSEAEYTAAVTGGNKTLVSASQQTLLEAPYGNKTLITKSRGTDDQATDKVLSYTFDLESTQANQAKNGSVYLCFYIDSYSGGNTSSSYYAKTLTPTLTVKGIPGESTATTVNDFSDTVLMWDGTDNSYDVCTQTTTGKAKLIAVTYNGTAMTAAKLVTIDAATKANGAISGTVAGLTVGDGETLKLYLWADGTLTPIQKTPIEF